MYQDLLLVYFVKPIDFTLTVNYFRSSIFENIQNIRKSQSTIKKNLFDLKKKYFHKINSLELLLNQQIDEQK